MKMNGIKEVRLYHVHNAFWCEVDYFSGRKISYANYPKSAERFVKNVNAWIEMGGEEPDINENPLYFHNWKRKREQHGAGYVDIYGYRDLSNAF